MSRFSESAYVRLAHLAYGAPERSDLKKKIRGAMLLSGLALMSAIDVADAEFDACLYRVDGSKGMGREAVVLTFDRIDEFVSGECFPSISLPDYQDRATEHISLDNLQSR